MKNLCFVFVFALVSAVTLFATEPPATGWDFKLTEDITVHLGGDFRARYYFYNRNNLNWDGGMAGPDVQYLRFRTRVWTNIHLGEDTTINLRLANRTQYYTTNTSNPNNPNDGSTWRFPDETVLDEANIELRRLFDIDGLSLKLGRQDLAFGNGMIFLEGTPFDQARSFFTDGLRLRYKDDNDDLNFILMYNSWKDRAVFINDQNRRLRSGDIFTTGIYWTHNFSSALNLDTYYFFDDVDDKHPESAERFYAADANTSLHTVGARLFGKLAESVDYSLEGAMQFGRNANGRANQGKMVDARLRWHLPDAIAPAPISLGFEYTHFSGDRSSTGKNEGWNPLWIGYPLWGDDIFSFGRNNNWNNLNLYQFDLTCKPVNKLTLKVYTTSCYAVHDTNATGGGSFIGQLVGFYAGYRLNEHLDISARYAHMAVGDYYKNGQNPNWFQLQLLWTF